MMNQHQIKQYLENNAWYGENRRILYSERALVSPSLIVPDVNSNWGMDISPWDGLVELGISKIHGCKFVYVKLLDGTITSKYGIENTLTAADVKLPHSAYAWLYRDANVVCKAQAQAYTTLLQKYPPSAGLPPAIDFETTYYGGALANPNYDDLRKWVTEFLRLGNPKPILYSGKWYMDPLGAMPSDLRGMFAGLWIANYSSDNPPLPTGWTQWAIHQYASTGDALLLAPGSTNKKELDLNRSAAAIPPDTGDTMVTGKVNAMIGLNIRDKADPNGIKLTALPYNAELTVNYYLTGTDGQQWYNVTIGATVNGYCVAQYVTITSGTVPPYTPPVNTKHVTVNVDIDGFNPLTLEGDLTPKA